MHELIETLILTELLCSLILSRQGNRIKDVMNLVTSGQHGGRNRSKERDYEDGHLERRQERGRRPTTVLMLS